MTKIAWTNETWNPIVGCSKISEGCKNCYAATAAQSARLQQFWQYREVKDWNGQVVFVANQLMKPFHWKKPKRIFVGSMSDLFHENIPDEWRDRIFSVIALCNHRHTFQLLTKRPAEMRDYLMGAKQRIRQATVDLGRKLNLPYELWEPYETCHFHWPMKNVWLGVTVENQLAADTRIPLLLQTPAAVRFVSCEPLLERLNLSQADYPVNWVIVGGESGAKARPCHLDWIRSIVNQCQLANIPVFVKQLGSNAIDSVPYIDGVALAHHQIKTSDRKGSDISQFADINFRQFPSRN